jgi:hypothetical protein
MNALIKVAALAALLSVTTAYAQGTDTAKTGAEPADYSKLDANGDGKVSKDEAMGDATLSAKFDELDKNKDGSLSTAELKASAEKRKEK